MYPQEFATGRWTKKNGDEMYVTSTLRHKTEEQGEADLFWYKDIKALAEIYLQYVRPLYDHETLSLLPSAPGVPSRAAFFINSTGTVLQSGQVTNRLKTIGKRLNPEMKGTLKASRIRKSMSHVYVMSMLVFG